LIIDFDYDPQTLPEIEPMAFAILRHAFTKRIKVLALSLYVQPLGLAQNALINVAEEFNGQIKDGFIGISFIKDINDRWVTTVGCGEENWPEIKWAEFDVEEIEFPAPEL